MMIVRNVVCNKCGNTLPPHHADTHLDAEHPIHECPHYDGDEITDMDEQLQRLRYLCTNLRDHVHEYLSGISSIDDLAEAFDYEEEE
tara:strand:- start:457 stop:717 length:261 start_codon:yes stop_codon:yes gene_type:complete